MARNCARPGVRLEPRSGAAADHVLEVAVREHADMIALGWSRRLGKGPAHTIKQRMVADYERLCRTIMLSPGDFAGPRHPTGGRTAQLLTPTAVR